MHTGIIDYLDIEAMRGGELLNILLPLAAQENPENGIDPELHTGFALE